VLLTAPIRAAYSLGMITMPWKKAPSEAETVMPILVVCTGNICRSPMAAYLLKHLLPEVLRDRVDIGSAGTYALHGHRATEPAVQVMAEAGIDLGSHRARQITGEMVRQAGLILVMERMHLDMVQRMRLWGKPRAKLLGEYGPRPESPEIEDPYGLPLETYRACLNHIRPCIEGVIGQLVSEMLRFPAPGSAQPA
jgi:protein-tyrosine phosphatase